MNKNKFVALLLVTEMLIYIISTLSLTVSAETFDINRPVSYTSSVSINIEQSGYYYIEAWGGNGGDGGSTSGLISAGGNGTGGVSEKSEGYFYLPAGTVVYIQVGVAGENGGDANPGTGGAGGKSAVAPYFGGGLSGGKGGNRYTFFNSDGGGGGAGGNASGILVNGTESANIKLASGGGGGAGGGAGSTGFGIRGENGGDGNVQNPSKQYGNESGSQGQGWSTDKTNGFAQFSPNGANGVLANGAGGGGGGGSGGGFDGNAGGGGGGGGGGSNSPQSGGGGAGGKNYSAGITLPDYIPSNISNNIRTNGANGQVYITFLGLAEYTVAFKANGGESVPPSQTVKFNDRAIEPSPPVLAGYTFGGWYKDSSFVNLWDFNIDTVTEDIILYAKWEKKTAEIAYRAEEGGSVNIDYETFNPEIEIPKGSTAIPEKGYRFAGWYYFDGLNEEPIYEAGENLIAGNLKRDGGLYITAVYIAKFKPADYNVSYSWSGDIPSEAVLPVDDGVYHINDVVKLAAVPQVQGYNFNGWLWDGYIYGGQDSFKMPDGDVEFEGFWTENNSYSVIYDTSGGTPKPDAIMDAAWTQSGLIPAEPPIKTGYDFTGWNVILGGSKKDVKNTDKYSDLADSDSTMEIILQAQWNPKSYAVNFDSNGASEVSPQTIEYGAFATEPDVPIKTGYIFMGWHKDNSPENLWDFNADTVTDDITLYAQWEKLSYKVEFADGLGGILSMQYVQYGDSAEAPADPTRKGYKFNGWIPADFSNITADRIFTAQWTEDIPTPTVDITSFGEPELVINEPFNPSVTEKSGDSSTPTEPTIDSSGLETSPAAEDFTSSEPENTAVQTELSVTETEIVILPDGVELVEYEDMEDLTDDALPLDNGWVAVDLSDDWWEVFDDSGIPLGMVNLPDDTDINDLDIEFIETNLIPLANIVTAAEAAKNETVSKLPEKNPQTADEAYAIFGLLALTAIIFGKKRRRTGR